MEGWKMTFQANENLKGAEVAILTSEKNQKSRKTNTETIKGQRLS
jgi:hypothetical protein